MSTALTPCTVYGDHGTCTQLRADAASIAAYAQLQPIAWYHDPTGLRGVTAPADARGLTEALAHCTGTGTPLHIPYAADCPGEQTVRLVAHWLDRHSLQLFIGTREHVWSRPADELDFAIRRLLDASADLTLAVAVAGHRPDLDRLASDLLGDEHTGAALAEARAIAARCAAADHPAPPEPRPGDPWVLRLEATLAYAVWLSGHRSQAFVAESLNALGVRTRSGRTWSRSGISRLISTCQSTRQRAA